MTSYDDWKLETPEEEREREREGALWRRFHRRWGNTDHDPDDARDAQQDREMRGED